MAWRLYVGCCVVCIIMTLVVRLADLDSRYQAKMKELSELAQQHLTTESTVRDLSTRLELAKKSSQDLESSKKTTEQELQETRKKLDAANEFLEKANKAKTALDTKLSDAEAAARQQTATTAALRADKKR